MPKTKIEIDLSVNDEDSVAKVEGKVVSLKSQLKQMKAELASGKLDNEAFNKLAAEAGALEDRIGDVNQRVKNLASDSQKLDGFISITQGIVGGFAAVQGITALVGDENEDLQKTMVKLQAAMSALSGIQAVANTLNKDSAAITALTTAKTYAQAAATSVMAFAMGGATVAAKALRIALLATGIGAIIVALTTLIPMIYDWVSGTGDQEEAQKKLNDEIDRGNDLLDSYTKDIQASTKMQIIEAKKLNASNDTIRQLEKQGRDREYERLQKDVDKKIELYANSASAGKEASDKALKDRDDAINKMYDMNRANEIADAQAELDSQNERLEQNKKYEDEQKKLRDKALEDIKAKNEENNALLKKYFEEQKAIIDEAHKVIEQQNFTDREKEYAALDEEFANKLKKIDVGSQGEADVRESWFIQRQELSKKYAEEDLKADEEKKAKLKDAEDKLNADTLENYRRTQAAKTQITSDTFSTLNNLGEIFIGQQYKQTALGKTIALAQIATDTALAISSLVRNSEANPLNIPTGGLAGIAQTIAGIARITANVAKAKSILNGGGSIGSSSGGLGSSTSTTSTAPKVNTFTNATNNNTNNSGNDNRRVYVVETDITNTQGRVARIRSNAEIV